MVADEADVQSAVILLGKNRAEVQPNPCLIEPPPQLTQAKPAVDVRPGQKRKEFRPTRRERPLRRFQAAR
jgi:hypothetical protein